MSDAETVERSMFGDAPRVEREFKFTTTDFRAIATIVHQAAGISLPEGKAPLVYARLVKRLRHLGITSFGSYVERLHGPHANEEQQFLLTALTTNVTRFFREPHHFEHLRRHLLEAHARREARLRLWSAACSTGQEPYSMAAVVVSTLPKPARSDVKILATDIDTQVLQVAQRGVYESVEGVPAPMRRYFESSGDSWAVSRELTELTTFRALNLNAEWPVRGPFDAIFCRNVAIYFDHATQAKLWQSFAAVLRPGGVLYIGHSERVSGPAERLLENIGITTYRRSGRA